MDSLFASKWNSLYSYKKSQSQGNQSTTSLKKQGKGGLLPDSAPRNGIKGVKGAKSQKDKVPTVFIESTPPRTATRPFIAIDKTVSSQSVPTQFLETADGSIPPSGVTVRTLDEQPQAIERYEEAASNGKLNVNYGTKERILLLTEEENSPVQEEPQKKTTPAAKPGIVKPAPFRAIPEESDSDKESVILAQPRYSSTPTFSNSYAQPPSSALQPLPVVIPSARRPRPPNLQPPPVVMPSARQLRSHTSRPPPVGMPSTRRPGIPQQGLARDTSGFLIPGPPVQLSPKSKQHIIIEDFRASMEEMIQICSEVEAEFCLENVRTTIGQIIVEKMNERDLEAERSRQKEEEMLLMRTSFSSRLHFDQYPRPVSRNMVTKQCQGTRRYAPYPVRSQYSHDGSRYLNMSTVRNDRMGNEFRLAKDDWLWNSNNSRQGGW